MNKDINQLRLDNVHYKQRVYDLKMKLSILEKKFGPRMIYDIVVDNNPQDEEIKNANILICPLDITSQEEYPLTIECKMRRYIFITNEKLREKNIKKWKRLSNKNKAKIFLMAIRSLKEDYDNQLEYLVKRNSTYIKMQGGKYDSDN